MTSARTLVGLVLLSTFASGTAHSDNQLFQLLTDGERKTETFVGPVGASYELTELRVTDTISARNGLRLMWITVPRERVKIKIGIIDSITLTGREFEHADCTNKSIVLGGGFFDNDENNKPKPIGLVISEGEEHSPLHSWKFGGVLVQYKEDLKIIPLREFKMDQNIDEALQSLPIVVWNSSNDIYTEKPNFWDRAAVGFTVDGQFIIAGSFASERRALTLFEFGALLSIPEEQGGPGVEQAIALDGGPGAHIFVVPLGRHYGRTGVKYLANIICIEEQPAD